MELFLNLGCAIQHNFTGRRAGLRGCCGGNHGISPWDFTDGLCLRILSMPIHSHPANTTWLPLLASHDASLRLLWRIIYHNLTSLYKWNINVGKCLKNCDIML